MFSDRIGAQILCELILRKIRRTFLDGFEVKAAAQLRRIDFFYCVGQNKVFNLFAQFTKQQRNKESGQIEK